MDDVTLASGVYRIGRFPNAVDELHLARKLAPVFVKMGPLMEALERLFPARPPDAPADWTPPSTDVPLADLMKDVEPFAQALADLPDERFEYVVNKCLEVVSRQSGAGGGFAAVRRGGVTMFADITASDTMQLAFAVIRENLSDFMVAPASASNP